MSDRKVEGTFRLDGLLEGPLFTEDDESYLHQFVEQTRQDSIRFSLSLQANRFSLLADQQVQIRPKRVPSIDILVTRHLDRLLRNYSLNEHQQVMSTVRSADISPGQETHTLYAIDAAGRIRTEQRTVACQTVTRAAPLTRRQLIVYGVVTVSIIILVLGVSVRFVPYKEMGSAFMGRLTAYDVNSLNITSSTYQALFEVVHIDYHQDMSRFILTCEVSDTFPTTAQQLNTAWVQANESMSQRLALESIARQQIRCRLYTESGETLGYSLIPMRWSPQHVTHFTLSIPFDRLIKRIELTF
jgi:hypothetical protein